MNYNLLNNLIFSYDWQNVLINNDVYIFVYKFNHKITDLIINFSKVSPISNYNYKKNRKLKIWIIIIIVGKTTSYFIFILFNFLRSV